MNSDGAPIDVLGVGIVAAMALVVAAGAVKDVEPKFGLVIAYFGAYLVAAGIGACIIFQYEGDDLVRLLMLRRANDPLALGGLIWGGYGGFIGGLLLAAFSFIKCQWAKREE